LRRETEVSFVGIYLTDGGERWKLVKSLQVKPHDTEHIFMQH